MSTDWYWALGLFEGEGCIHIRKNKPQAHLFVGMTDLDVLTKLQKIWGGSITKQTAPRNPTWKQAWRWNLYKKEAVSNILVTILPYLSDRRACKALDCA